MIDPQEIQGFSQLNRQQRYQKLLDWGLLSLEDIAHLKQGSPVSHNMAEHFIENVIGFFQIPLGIVPHFVIDGQSYVVPMAVEETSIIAAASKTAKWVRENGVITTACKGNGAIGQMQIAQVKDIAHLQEMFQIHRVEILKDANKLVPRLQQRGGGFYDLKLRILSRKKDNGLMAIFHLYVDTKDAMGANMINQVCEGLKSKIEKLTGEKITMCIVSNLSDTKCVQAEVVLEKMDSDLGHKIEEASYFAEVDPYRATTNNKGVLNGIDPVLIATGNDWRAVEAGLHSYASRSGRYTSITKWKMDSGCLKGFLETPMSLGTVGGVTRLHPTAKMCLKMLKVTSAQQLARIIAAVGLVQNLGALRALSTVGVVKGHLHLHTANLAMTAGATTGELTTLKKALQEQIKDQKKVSVSEAISTLQTIRSSDNALIS